MPIYASYMLTYASYAYAYHLWSIQFTFTTTHTDYIFFFFNQGPLLGYILVVIIYSYLWRK